MKLIDRLVNCERENVLERVELAIQENDENGVIDCTYNVWQVRQAYKRVFRVYENLKDRRTHTDAEKHQLAKMHSFLADCQAIKERLYADIKMLKTLDDIIEHFASYTIYAYEDPDTNEKELYVADNDVFVAHFECDEDGTYAFAPLPREPLQKHFKGYYDNDTLSYELVQVGERYDAIHFVTLDQIRSLYASYKVYTDDYYVYAFDANGICIASFQYEDVDEENNDLCRYSSCTHNIGQTLEYVKNNIDDDCPLHE